MKTKLLLIALVLVAAPLLGGCSAKHAPISIVPEGAQAGELIGLAKCDFQPAKSKTTYAADSQGTDGSPAGIQPCR
jgi:hypothetical protein